MKIKLFNKIIESFNLSETIGSMIKTSIRDNLCSYVEAEFAPRSKSMYQYTSEWLAIYNPKFRDTQRKYKEDTNIHIPVGNYIFKMQKCNKYTYCYVVIVNSTNDNERNITLHKNKSMKIYLIGKDYKYFQKLYKNYIDYKLFYEKKDTICVYNTAEETCIDIPKKSFDTIIFKDKRKLNNALCAFMRSETKQLHAELGIMHKLGILLYGPGGTGKTSIARAIASNLNTDIYILDEKNIQNFEETQNRIDRYKNKPVVILIEDIDCIVPVNREYDVIDKKAERTERIEKLLFQKLLQILDGINSAGNVIFIATTNAPLEELDTALKRKGRFNEKYHVDLFDNITQVSQMCDIVKLNEYDKNRIIEKYTDFLKTGKKIVPSNLQTDLLTIKEEEFKNI